MQQFALKKWGALLFGCALCAISARADLKFTTEFRRSGYDYDPDKTERTVIISIKGDKRRVENTWFSESRDGNISSGRATFIVLGEKRQQIWVHEAQKTYWVMPLRNATRLIGETGPDGKLRIVQDNSPATKEATINVSISQLEEGTIAGVKARRYFITYREKLSEKSPYSSKRTSEVWLAEDLAAELKDQPQERLTTILQPERLPAPWSTFWNPTYKTTFEGDTELYNQIKNRVVLSSRTQTGILVGNTPPPPRKFTGGEIIDIREVTSLSRAR
jgi:hypothetical protein